MGLESNDMASAAANPMTAYEHKYHDITELYTLADELLATVETASNPQMQLGLVEALIETMGESADVLTDEYIALIEGSPARKKSAKSRAEGALRKIYVAMSEVSVKARDAKNAVHGIMKKIKRQLEQVIVNFVELVALSLDRIMQKHDMDDLKARHANIALALYSKGQGQNA